MRIPSTRQRGLAFEQTMTPLIDIVFQLLIFFVCASTGHLREFLLPTDFAAGGIPADVAPAVDRPINRIWIRLFRENDVTLTEIEGTSYRPEDNVRGLLQTLAQAASDAPLVLEIDGDVPMGDLVSLVDVCKTSGFKTVQFAADAEAAARQP